MRILATILFLAARFSCIEPVDIGSDEEHGAPGPQCTDFAGHYFLGVSHFTGACGGVHAGDRVEIRQDGCTLTFSGALQGQAMSVPNGSWGPAEMRLGTATIECWGKGYAGAMTLSCIDNAEQCI